MKKIMMMALMALVAVAVQAADDKVTLTSGDGQWIWEIGKTATVEMDYSNTVAEGEPLMQHLKKRGDQIVADWPALAETARLRFIEQFNRRIKKGLRVVESGEADINIKIIVEKLHFGNTATAVIFGGLGSAGGAEITGKMIVTDKDGKTLATYDLHEVRGRGAYDFTEGKRLGAVYDQMIRMVVKASK